MRVDRKTPTVRGIVARVGATVVLLAWLGSRIDLSTATLQWDQRALLGAAAACALLLLAQLLSALRWWLILRTADAPLQQLFGLTLIGLFFGLFLPTSVGGDAVRAIGASRLTGRPSYAATSVLLDRLLGMLALAGLLLLGLLLAPAASAGIARSVRWGAESASLATLLGAALLLCVGVAGLLVRRHGAARRVVREGWQLVAGFGTRPAVVLASLLVALAVQLTYILAWYGLGWALRLPVSALDFLVFVPLVSLAAMLPLTLSGLGLREGAWALLLAPYGVTAMDAVAFSLLYFLTFALVAAVGGVSLAIRGAGAVTGPRGAATEADPRGVAQGGAALV